MNVVFRRAWYAYKLMFSGYFIGALLLGIALLVVTLNIDNWHFGEASISILILIYAVVMPLLTIVLVANAFAEELEELTLPLLWTYPVNKPVLILERLLLVLLIVAIYMGAAFGAIHLWLVELVWKDIWLILKASMSAHLFLAGVTLLCSLIGRNMLIGLAGGALYWLVEMVTLGEWTKGLFLFQSVWVLEGYDPSTQVWWIYSAALILIVLSVFVFLYGRHWVAKKG